MAAAPEDAVQFVSDVTSNADDPVVMFSHEWCEFCWSVRKMFAKYEVPYRSIDLDSVEYQQDNKGGEIRKALRERTTSKTIPQIFIGGQYIGGATELFDAARDGTMQELLKENIDGEALTWAHNRLIGRTIDFLARSQSFLHAGKIPLNPLIIPHYKVDLLLIRDTHVSNSYREA